VTDVGNVVDVENRRRDVEGGALWHASSLNLGARGQRTLVEVALAQPEAP
jgi:hypothetical protein